MAKAIIIHGLGATSKDNWFPWLKQELEKLGFVVITPDMPQTLAPKLDKWIAKLEETTGKPNEKTILVGHSLGATTILRYLETLPKNEKIGGAVLVGCPVEIGNYGFLKTFFEKPWNWKEIKKHCNNIVVLHSEDDPLVPMKNAQIMEEKLGAQIILAKDEGHFCNKEHPIILEKVLEYAKE